MPIPPSRHYFEDFVELTRSLQSREQLFDIFVRVMLAHGYDRLNFSVTRDRDLGAADMGFGLISTYATDWQAHYRDRALGRIDPVLHTAHGGVPPFRWRDLEQRLILTDRQIKFLRDAEAAGMHNGVGFPLGGPMQSGGVALATSSHGVAPCRNLDLLNAFCQQFCSVYKRLCIRRRDIARASLAVLSVREAEILAWIARGHGDSYIALNLGISRNTIDFHVRNIFRKLDVNGRVAAVVVALTYGLLQL